MMKKQFLSVLLVCAASALFFPLSLYGQAQGNLAAVLPAESEEIDDLTLQVLDSALEDEVSKLGYTLVEKDQIAAVRPDSCLSASCSETVDFLALGKNLNSDYVIHPTIKRKGEEVTVFLGIYEIEAGSVKAVSKTIKASSLLVAVKEMLQEVLPEAGPPPTAPTPPPPVEPPKPPEPPAPAPPVEEPAEGEAGKPEEKPAETLTPPGKIEGEEEEKAQEAVEEKKEKKKKKKLDQKGRVPVIVTSGVFAMALGTGILLAAEVDDWRYYPPVIILGGATGVVVSLVSTAKFKVTRGDAAMYDAMIGWSIVNGLLIPPAAGSTKASKIALGGVIGGSIGLAGGIAMAALMDPYYGDAVFLSIVGVWGAAYAEIITGLVQPDEGKKYFTAGLIGLDIGLVAGGILSAFIDVSPLRSAIITMVGIAGAGLGALAGLAFVARENPSSKDWRIFTGMLLAGTTLGVVGGVFISAIAEKKIKEKRKKKGKEKEEGNSQAMLPFLVYHTRDGWGMGMPAITPISTGRAMGVHTSILGGVF
jgi:hypothetical protein